MNATMIILTRRQAIKVAGLTCAVAVAATVIPAPTAFAAQGAPTAATVLSDLPRLYGTPTDLARTTSKTAWSREPDDTVLVFDPGVDAWVPRPDWIWADLLTQGTTYLARWGRSPSHQLVLVLMDSAPEPPTPPSPSPPTTPGPENPAPTTPMTPQPDNKPRLANTGAPLAPLGVGATLAVAAGALLSFRNRRMRPGTAAEQFAAGTPAEGPFAEGAPRGAQTIDIGRSDQG